VPGDFGKEGRYKEMRVCSEKMYGFFSIDLFCLQFSIAHVECRFIDFCLGVPLYPLRYTILIC
jgi:hypothetical protein